MKMIRSFFVILLFFAASAQAQVPPGGGTGGSGSSGTVTAPGVAGTQAQAVQGIPGGVPAPVVPPIAASGKILTATCTIPATTSTALSAACARTDGGGGNLTLANWQAAYGFEAQPISSTPSGSLPMGLSKAGAALSNANVAPQIGTAGALYTSPTGTAVVPTVWATGALTLLVTLTLQ